MGQSVCARNMREGPHWVPELWLNDWALQLGTTDMSLMFGVELLVRRVTVSDVCMYKSINNQLWNLRGVGGERWGNTICGSKDYTR